MGKEINRTCVKKAGQWQELILRDIHQLDVIWRTKVKIAIARMGYEPIREDLFTRWIWNYCYNYFFSIAGLQLWYDNYEDDEQDEDDQSIRSIQLRRPGRSTDSYLPYLAITGHKKEHKLTRSLESSFMLPISFNTTERSFLSCFTLCNY